ncbi:MAG: MGMT family protein [Candidatus Moranbacteria bacterium]|jgi:O-6-methylguanine DNA methyltransferase|nr:MGMT family protein [Candidatus Moranbacteria bacterium]
MKIFSERVRDEVRKIPKGKTATYAEIAARVGSPGASRAVGSVLRKNFDPEVPCHRVIRSDGSLGRYNRGDAEKERLLREEGTIR